MFKRVLSFLSKFKKRFSKKRPKEEQKRKGGTIIGEIGSIFSSQNLLSQKEERNSEKLTENWLDAPNYSSPETKDQKRECKSVGLKNEKNKISEKKRTKMHKTVFIGHRISSMYI